MRRILLALALLVAPAVAKAIDETCHFTSSGDWSSATAYSGTDDCTLDANDAIVIDSGVTATITGDITQGSGASIGVTVASGGTLVGAVTSPRLTLTTGTLGLTCASGSVCTLTGLYLTPGPSPTWSSTPSATAYLVVGDVVACPGGDCTLVRFSYPDAAFNAASGTALDRGIDNSIGAIAAGDIACLWNPTQAPKFGTPDVNMCYPVAAASAAGSPYTLDLTVRVAPNLPVAAKQQDLLTGTLSSAAARGSRSVSVPGTTIGTGEESIFVGRWIRMEQASGGTLEPFAYRILRATDGGGGGATPDTLTLARLDGLQRDYASGDDFSIDYGWRRGDPLLIYRPMRLASATAAYNDSEMVFSGTTTLRAVHVEKVQDLKLSGAGVVDAGLTDIYLEESDQGTQAGGLMKITSVTTPLAFTRLVMVGGDASGSVGGQTQHGVLFQTSGPQTVSFTDSLFRYQGDDCLVPDAAVGGTITLTRFRCQWGADGGSSQQLVDMTASAMGLSASQIECLDCTNHDSDSASEAFKVDGTGAVSVSGAVLYGVRGSISKSYYPAAPSWSNVAIIGGGDKSLTSNANWALPRMTNFVMREVWSATSGSYLYNTNLNSSPNIITWRNGLVVDFRQTATPNPLYAIYVGVPASAPTISNVAFIDLVNANANATLNNPVSTEVDGATYTNITLAYRPGFTAASGLVRGWSVSDTSPAYTLSRSLFTGMLRTSAVGIYGTSASAYAAPLARDRNCFFSNTSDISAALASGLTSDSVRDAPMSWMDAAGERYSSRPGSLGSVNGCGARANAGITTYQWIHAISDLEPENLGTLGSQGGSSGWLPRAF